MSRLIILPLRVRVDVPDIPEGEPITLPEIEFPTGTTPTQPPIPPTQPPAGATPPALPLPVLIPVIDLRGVLPRAPQNTPAPARARKDRVTVHWLGGAFNRAASDTDAAAFLMAIARDHITKNWASPGQPYQGGAGIMYHEAIAPSGTRFVLRDFDEVTWHAAHNEANLYSHAELVMSGPGSPETPAQMATLAQRLRDFAVPVFGHKEWSGTACPGDNLMRYVQSLR